MKGLNNRKTIVILILILLVGIVGLTVAYFSNTTSIDNLFSTKDYGTTIEEVFISPDNWLPGTTTDKEITVTNSGSVDEAVRISYTERWVAKDGTVLSGLIDEDGNLTDNNENSEHAAIINFSNNGDWNYFNGYYYYNYKLSPNDTTSSLIDSVTFNSKVKNSSNCTTTENNGVKTITCNSTNSGYDGATYTLTLTLTLTFTIETVQFDKYMSAWGTDVAIALSNSYPCDFYEEGELITYNNEEYHVLVDSPRSSDYITLLKKEPLTSDEINAYKDDYISQNGEYPYYESDTCNENTQTGCSTNYDTSDVKKIVDGWSSSFSDDLKEVNGYKTRLIIKDALSFYLTFGTDSNGNVLYYLNAPYYLRISDNKNIWTAIGYNDSNNEVSQINFYPGIKNIKIYNKLYIRPVINIKKSVIECNCTVSDVPYKEYSVGEEIIYDSNKYYVLENSNSSKKYVTLLKDELMSANEVNNYKIENSEHYDSQNGEYPYCINRSSCSAEYNDSGIKDLLDNWSFKYNNDLVAVDGYKIRNPFWREIYNLRINDNIPEWAFIDNKIYWSDTHAYSDNLQTISSSSNLYSIDDMTNKNYIRPVINLKKCAIDGKCNNSCNNSSSSGNNNLYDYVVGNNVTYNNSNYCIIQNAKVSDDYITLIKQEPLTYDELVTYNNGYEIGRNNIDNNIGTISYYKSDTCYYNDENDKNITGCSNDYNDSFIKNVVNNWSNSIRNDLKEVNGYKARLITKDELNKMGHIYHSRTSSPVITQSEYSCLYIDTDYWTMGSSEDSAIKDIVSKIDGNNGPEYVDKQYAVRPVINLKKCAITNTCE